MRARTRRRAREPSAPIREPMGKVAGRTPVRADAVLEVARGRTFP